LSTSTVLVGWSTSGEVGGVIFLHRSCQVRGREGTVYVGRPTFAWVTDVPPKKENYVLKHARDTSSIEPGATALESEGPHIPDGMLQRLNVIAQRTGRRNHHDGFGNESRGDGTPDASTSTNRRSGNPLFDAETLRTPTSGRRPEIDGIGRPGWRRSSTEQHREYRRADDLHGGETAAFSTADGERWGSAQCSHLKI